MDFRSGRCEWAGCREIAATLVGSIPVCDKHAVVAQRMETLETGFLLGLGLGVLDQLLDRQSPGDS